ncbi:hypothetical protein EG68_03544 [Paragonimus skrjabini miyazakii]|uniref:Complement component 1 Q subcomponent-binding protein, mitochondrial n=1 Tax=Paragonimus skrjabini miyazakii TaxID=59628 RepID=A0A8S9YVP1_9TREM|nr:hypothetical protein EG68_03544 [Paragonimus skrjabini miyazakii]
MMHRSLTRLYRGITTTIRFAKLPKTPQPSIYSCFSTLKSPAFIQQKHFSSQVDRQFTEVLSNEIKQEQENMYSCNPPRGFTVAKAEGTDILLKKEYSDGVCVEIGINLAGSINPEMEDVEEEHPASDKKDDVPVLEAHPDIRIRLVKPSGRSVVFNCSLPSRDTRSQMDSENSNVPTYSVDSVEMERLPGYFVYTDLFDDTMYDHTMQLLMERKLDAQFQNELQEFCTAEEHKLYLKFLDEFHAYCRD